MVNTKSLGFLEVMSWINKQGKPNVGSLKKYLIKKGLRKNKAKSLAKSYRYIIDMKVNVDNYNQQRLK